MNSFAAKRASRDARKPKSFVRVDEGEKPPSNTGMDLVTKESIAPGVYNTLPASLEIRRDNVKGRGVWSRKAFSRGTILFVHRPHVAVLSTPSLSTNCSSCTSSPKNAGTLKRCAKCKTVWYCSSACQNDDWAVHKHECAAISNWMSSAPDGSPPGEAIRTLGRILWGRALNGDTSPWWKEIQAFQSHRSSLPKTAVESHTQLAHALVRYLRVSSPAELEQFGLHSSGDLVDLISRFTTNTFTLTTPSLSPLGTCVSPIAALFNHSCLPNAVIVFPHSSSPTSSSSTSLKEPTLTIIAIKDISPEEEILTAYIDTSLPTNQRQQSLNETYNFTCTCALCTGAANPEIDPREALWCPKMCGGRCPAPQNKETSIHRPRCIKCGTAFTSSALNDVEDKIRIGKEALEKATSLQSSDPARALNLTSHVLELLMAHLPPSSHPALALLRLHQSLLIASLASSTAPDVLNTTIRATARAISGLLSVFIEGHPVRGIALAELGKLLAVDEPLTSESGTPTDGVSPPAGFPPSGAARLALAVEVQQRALKELRIGFGENTEGGSVGKEVREEIVNLEREMSVWNRGVRNVPGNMTAFLSESAGGL